MMATQNVRPQDMFSRPAKKALNFNNDQPKLTRRPLGGRNVQDLEGFVTKVATKTTYDIGKSQKDETDAKISVKQSAKSILAKYRKTKPQPFSVPLPKTLQPSIQEASEDLSKLSSAIDSLLAEVPKNVEKIDQLGASSFYSPLYAQDIINYQMERERKFALSPDFLETTGLKASSRGVLVDWMIQVQTHSGIESESLYIAVALLDRMLSTRPVSLGKLQLIGVVCLFIACKINERFPPEIDELLRLTENAYTRSELIKAERLVLRSIGFDLYLPTVVPFVDRCVQASKYELGDKVKEVKCMALYLIHLGLADARVSAILPSKRAAAAFWLARKLLLTPGSATWNPSLTWYSGYREGELSEVNAIFAKLCIKAPEARFQGARSKYSSNSRYSRISHHRSLNNLTLLRNVAYSSVN